MTIWKARAAFKMKTIIFIASLIILAMMTEAAHGLSLLGIVLLVILDLYVNKDVLKELIK